MIKHHDLSKYNLRRTQAKKGGEMQAKDILSVITAYREERGWTKYQLIERSVLPQSTISSIPKSGARCMILHSDRGSQFASSKFSTVLKKYGTFQSMSSAGCYYDNARMESFFTTLKKDKLYQIDTQTLTREEVQTVIFRYISYYNFRHITSANNDLPPLVYRQRYLDQSKEQAA